MKTRLGSRVAGMTAIAVMAVSLAACSGLNRDYITVTGKITDQGRECVTFRADDGTLYALANKAQGLRPGDRVRVTGHSALMTTCTEAPTLIVDKLTPLKAAGSE